MPREKEFDPTMGDEMIGTMAGEAVYFEAIEALRDMGESDLAKIVGRENFRRGENGNIYVELDLEE